MEHAVFPAEVIGKAPLITLTGSAEVHIEQHLGLVSYQPEKVVFRTASGLLTISGHELFFSRYRTDEAMLTGTINGVEIAAANGGVAP